MDDRLDRVDDGLDRMEERLAQMAALGEALRTPPNTRPFSPSQSGGILIGDPGLG